MKIVVIGTGYVGLVAGTCFAEMGNKVTCVDVDAAKVAQLQRGHVPIHEPGLDALLAANTQAGRLAFSDNLARVLPGAEAVFIAVGTPQGPDGAADLQQVMDAATAIGASLDHYAVIAIKSTVPVGTADAVSAVIRQGLARRGVTADCDVISNPEFVKEGAAVRDFMSPDRVIIGTGSERARDTMRELYRTFMRTHDRLMFMGVHDAELAKYAANAMLATKISFINEIAGIAERVGADIENVRLGIGADQRIGHHFIYPGCGYGGSCFPKDVKALVHAAEAAGFDPVLLKAVEARNARQKTVLFDKLAQYFDQQLAGREIAVWGLAFKPGTDDVREAPALDLLRQLLAAGARVRAHDPVAIASARTALGGDWEARGQLRFTEDPYAALDGADALVLVTEWKQYRQPDFADIRQRLRTPLVIDGRNQYNPQRLRQLGFLYSGVGRSAGS